MVFHLVKAFHTFFLWKSHFYYCAQKSCLWFLCFACWSPVHTLTPYFVKCYLILISSYVWRSVKKGIQIFRTKFYMPFLSFLFVSYHLILLDWIMLVFWWRVRFVKHLLMHMHSAFIFCPFSQYIHLSVSFSYRALPLGR